MTTPQPKAGEPPCGWRTLYQLFFRSAADLIRQSQASESNEHKYDELLKATQDVISMGQMAIRAHAYPVPQRLQFPVCLRRMWSGRDVQDWLDAQAAGVPGTPDPELNLNMPLPVAALEPGQESKFAALVDRICHVAAIYHDSDRLRQEVSRTIRPHFLHPPPA